MLVDTDVFIWYMKGNERALRVLGNTSGFFISSVTYMELLQGLRSKKELAVLKEFLRTREFHIFHIDRTISTKSTFLMELYYLSHNLRLADAMIAATALNLSVPLITANVKHYKMIKGLDIDVFKP